MSPIFALTHPADTVLVICHECKDAHQLAFMDSAPDAQGAPVLVCPNCIYACADGCGTTIASSEEAEAARWVPEQVDDGLPQWVCHKCADRRGLKVAA